MAFDAFMKFDGITGESQDHEHKGEIELLSFSFGGSNASSVGRGQGGGAGKVNLTSFNVMKYTDATSPQLFQKMCQGAHFKTVKVTLRKAGGDKPLNYLVYDFEEVFVDNMQWSGSTGGDDTPMENLSFSYGKVVITYTQQKADGTAAGNQVGGWDVRSNKKA